MRVNSREPKRGKYQVYRDAQNKWRWRFVSPNGRTMADSGEGYHSERAVVEAIRRFNHYNLIGTYMVIFSRKGIKKEPV